ncbi:MAG TPA: hypothetical protein VFT59_00795 [Candidatus Saccharimonadales bacterium]|nr:hypothetical protein [Candidatus Saccharimonadales bacterium]
MSTTTLFDAHRAMLGLAGRGGQYRQDQVFQPAEEDAARAAIVGKGFDLERNITVNPGDAPVDAVVQLRVLAMLSGNLFIRIWLNWTSPFGNHRAFVNYDLSSEAINTLAEQVPDDKAQEANSSTANTMTDDEALNVLFEHFEAQDTLGTNWYHEYPDFTDEIIAHHVNLVLAARKSEPKLLGMLSDSELGAAEAQEIIDLYDWLRQQPEVTSLA